MSDKIKVSMRMSDDCFIDGVPVSGIIAKFEGPQAILEAIRMGSYGKKGMAADVPQADGQYISFKRADIFINFINEINEKPISELSAKPTDLSMINPSTAGEYFDTVQFEATLRALSNKARKVIQENHRGSYK